MRVLVCHPGRQHSHQLAMALAARGMLAQYITGVPTHRGAGGSLGRPFLQRLAGAYAIPIDPGLVKHVYIASVLRNATRNALSSRLASTIGHRADGLFDRYVSRFLPAIRPDVVVAYENSALHTFRRAKQLGIKTILDAASVHHAWGERFVHPIEREAAHQRTKHRKDAEVRLADEILTVSDFARESYVEAGVPSKRVHAVPVGVDADRFRPRASCSQADTVIDREFRFVYVGNATRLKGIDVLREAACRLRAAGERFTTVLIGVASAPPDGQPSDGLVRMGWMSHERLAAELPRHDALVLPSFFDSFGMVVAEAMACGLPAIVTQNVGAKEMITPGVNGLIVPAGDSAALADAMRWFIAQRKHLSHMARAARDSAQNYDWANYHRRIVEFFVSI